MGKDGSGISKAIEAKKRVKLEGLGVRPEHKQELKKEKEEEEEERKKKKKIKREYNWKIDVGEVKPKKKKKVYKTAEEIQEEAEELGAGSLGGGEPKHVAIVDMRGKQAKLVRYVM